MSDEEFKRLARSFGPVAEAYDRGRPGYPGDAVTWLVGSPGSTVLELGAGTGKLTVELAALGHDVHATDPSAEMLEILRERVPTARVSQSPAEEIPLGDCSVDVVVVAQAFHWFDLDKALPEIARVLRPGGDLSLVWNERDTRIPWVRRLGDLIGTQEQLRDPAQPLVESGLFGFVEERDFKIWQDINRETILDLVTSRSNVAVLDEPARQARLAAVSAFYDDYGRGMDGMQLPYVTRCYRATVLDRPYAGGTDSGSTNDSTTSSPTDGTDTDMLLIDFR
jgi:SAM-dependent methyltransferase